MDAHPHGAPQAPAGGDHVAHCAPGWYDYTPDVECGVPSGSEGAGGAGGFQSVLKEGEEGRWARRFGYNVRLYFPYFIVRDVSL